MMNTSVCLIPLIIWGAIIAVTLTFLAIRSSRRSQIFGWGMIFGGFFLIAGLVILGISYHNPVQGYQSLPYPNNLKLIDPTKPIELISDKDNQLPNQISPDERVMMRYPTSHYLELKVTFPDAFDALQGLWRGRRGLIIVDGLQRGKFSLLVGNPDVSWDQNVQHLERKVSPTGIIRIPIDAQNPQASPDERTLLFRLSMDVVYPDITDTGETIKQHKTLTHDFEILLLTPTELDQYQKSLGQARRIQLRLFAPYYGALLGLGLLMIVIPLIMHWHLSVPIRLRPPVTSTTTETTTEPEEEETSI
ncbi:MAG: hypothetical protein J7L73_01635 [Anaerolineales bacterium]|nr:hypothetical protein [Anaerolineales bacterium]